MLNEVVNPLVEYGKSYYTPEEYLEREENAFEKSEFYQGEIFAMSGSGLKHNLIFNNFLEMLL